MNTKIWALLLIAASSSYSYSSDGAVLEDNDKQEIKKLNSLKAHDKSLDEIKTKPSTTREVKLEKSRVGDVLRPDHTKNAK